MKMKNKQVEKMVRRKAQNQSLSEKKYIANKLDLKRTKPIIEKKQSFLIVCEGKNTEPDYFRNFKIKTATIKTVGLGYNTLSLVNRAEELRKQGNYDQVWCVFDKDDFLDFDEAIQKAAKLGFKTAWSNQAFEYWLLLHFEDHQGGGMNRKLYYDKINTYLKPFDVVYDEDSKNITDEIFFILKAQEIKTNISREDLAIKRAKRNLKFHEDETPKNSESCTTVFQLVEEILKYE